MTMTWHSIQKCMGSPCYNISCSQSHTFSTLKLATTLIECHFVLQALVSGLDTPEKMFVKKFNLQNH